MERDHKKDTEALHKQVDEIITKHDVVRVEVEGLWANLRTHDSIGLGNLRKS